MLLMAACASPLSCSLPATHTEASVGHQQLVDALDAGWVRALDQGTIRKMILEDGMSDVVINIADCLPAPQLVPFPAQPVGLLKKILDQQRIRVGRSAGPNDAGATAYYFDTRSRDVLQPILAELAGHYGSGPITIEYITIPPPYRLTTALNDGSIDIIGTVNALGGETEELRRRKSRRFTCTLTATRQFLWILKEGGPGWTTVQDAFADEDARFCAGPLSNQLSNAYFKLPGQKVVTDYGRDLDGCLSRLVTGKADAMVSPFPQDRFFPKAVDTDGDGKPDRSTEGLFRAIDTNIVAGTPLWVALD